MTEDTLSQSTMFLDLDGVGACQPLTCNVRPTKCHRQQRQQFLQFLTSSDMGFFQTKAPRLQATKQVFDGLITNDKFCFTRHRQLHLNWWRRPLRLRQSPLLNSSLAHSGESHDTAVEHPAAGRGAQRRSAPPRSSLSTPSAMGAGTIHRTPDAGGEP